MPWQDYVFSIGSLIFAAALIPSVKGKDKPALSTSLTTGGALTNLRDDVPDTIALVLGVNYIFDRSHLVDTVMAEV